MRYNIFNLVHMPLRLALLNASVHLQQEENLPEHVIVQKVQEVTNLLKCQLQNEEQFILPIIFEYEAGVWDMYTRQHHKAKNVIREIEALIEEFHQADREEEQWMITSSIQDRFHYLVLATYHHMDDEEEVLNEILWRYHNDAFLLQLQKQMQSLPGVVKTYERPRVVQSAFAA